MIFVSAHTYHVMGRSEFLTPMSRTLGSLVERATTEERAVVVNGKLLTNTEHCEASVEGQVVKARLVALGNVLTTKHGQVWKDLAGWAGCRQRSTSSKRMDRFRSEVMSFSPCFLHAPQEVLSVFVGVPDFFGTSNSWRRQSSQSSWDSTRWRDAAATYLINGPGAVWLMTAIGTNLLDILAGG